MLWLWAFETIILILVWCCNSLMEVTSLIWLHTVVTQLLHNQILLMRAINSAHTRTHQFLSATFVHSVLPFFIAFEILPILWNKSLIAFVFVTFLILWNKQKAFIERLSTRRLGQYARFSAEWPISFLRHHHRSQHRARVNDHWLWILCIQLSWLRFGQPLHWMDAWLFEQGNPILLLQKGAISKQRATGKPDSFKGRQNS